MFQHWGGLRLSCSCLSAENCMIDAAWWALYKVWLACWARLDDYTFLVLSSQRTSLRLLASANCYVIPTLDHASRLHHTSNDLSNRSHIGSSAHRSYHLRCMWEIIARCNRSRILLLTNLLFLLIVVHWPISHRHVRRVATWTNLARKQSLLSIKMLVLSMEPLLVCSLHLHFKFWLGWGNRLIFGWIWAYIERAHNVDSFLISVLAESAIATTSGWTYSLGGDWSLFGWDRDRLIIDCGCDCFLLFRGHQAVKFWERDVFRLWRTLLFSH